MFRNAQGFSLTGPTNSMNQAAGVTAFDVSATASIDLLLQDLVFTGETVGAVGTTTNGTIDSITLAGQQLMTTNTGADVNSFVQGALPSDPGVRAIACPIAANQIFRIQATWDAPATGGFAVGTDPLQVPVTPVNQLGSALSYCAGLGTQAIAASAGIGVLQQTTFTVTINRDCILGRVCLSQTNAAAFENRIAISSILVNQLEMLSGAGDIPLPYFSALSSDNDGLTLGIPVRENAQVTFVVSNFDAVATNLRGTIFCLPVV